MFQKAYIYTAVGRTSEEYTSRSKNLAYQSEHIPIHSPLLRNSCLVYFPPLTYMLKFSGFADLTSCLESDRRGTKAKENRETSTSAASEQKHACMIRRRNRQGYLHAFNASRAATKSSTLTHNDTEAAISNRQGWRTKNAIGRRGGDAEAGMLSGISRKCILRSSSYWFTEICNSQCLSQFAAPFIVVRAETSIAESCKKENARADVCETHRQQAMQDAKKVGRNG